jgi:hypothetical protein
MLIDMHDTHMLLALLAPILQTHTDMGDERASRLVRRICPGRAALRGSRVRGTGICGLHVRLTSRQPGPESARTPSGSAVQAATRCATEHLLVTRVRTR